MNIAMDAAEAARNRFVKGELEAGLVYAANAIEYQRTNPMRAAAFRADAQDCYAVATRLLRESGSIQGWPPELGAMLDELQGRLETYRHAKLVLSAAA